MVRGRNLAMACFCMGPRGRMVFTSLKGYKKHKEVYATEAICGSQSLKYLLPGPLQQKFADHYSRVKSTGCSNTSYYVIQQKLSLFKPIS